MWQIDWFSKNILKQVVPVWKQNLEENQTKHLKSGHLIQCFNNLPTDSSKTVKDQSGPFAKMRSHNFHTMIPKPRSVITELQWP